MTGNTYEEIKARYDKLTEKGVKQKSGEEVILSQ